MRFGSTAPAALEAQDHARYRFYRCRRAPHRGDGSLCRRLPPSLKEKPMAEPIIGLLIGVLLGVYLLYTLIYPEKF